MKDFTEVITTIKIQNKKIKDLITTAFEGGSNYWACYKFPDGWKEKYISAEEIVFNGGNIEVFDVETDKLLGVLNQVSIRYGLQLMANCQDAKGRDIPERHFGNLLSDNEDVETADVFIQLCVMTEIVFG